MTYIRYKGLFIASKILTGFLNTEGVMISHKTACRYHYITSREFVLDILSVLPLDLAYFINHKAYPLVRLNRLLRWGTVTKFFDRTIHITK